MTILKPKQLVVISAGLSLPSSTRLLADRLAEATQRRLADDGVASDLLVVELRDHAHDIMDQMVRGFADDSLDKVIEALSTADGAIAVTPIFTTSYSGLFKSFIDILDPTSLAGLPVLLGATGGTERHSLALDYAVRPLFTYLHATPLPTTVYAATSDWGTTAAAGSTDLRHRIDRAASELAQEMVRPDRAGRRQKLNPLALPAGFDPSGRQATRSVGVSS